MNDVVIPEGMLKAALDGWENHNPKMTIEYRCQSVLEVALRWLSDLSESEFFDFIREVRSGNNR